MSIGFDGKTYPLVSQDKMMPSELDAVERVTGLTLQKIRRMGEMCVCEHGVKAHTHRDDSGDQVDDTSCVECDCDQHQGDVPMRVMTAFAWVSVKRGDPSVKYADFADGPLADWDVEDDDAEADPTQPPLGAE